MCFENRRMGVWLEPSRLWVRWKVRSERDRWGVWEGIINRVATG